VRDNPRFEEDALFWQYPARTEQDAWQRVSQAREFPLESGHHSIYIGLPWATFIDREMFPETALVAAASKIKWVARYLAEHGVELRVNTVCQHILWERHIQRFKKLGITDLWVSHKEKGIDELYGVRLHGWTLYAVNQREPDRREGITNKPVAKRQHRASFQGAYTGHYLSDVRLKLKELIGEPGFEIKLTNDWHFNQAVYQYQVQGKATPTDFTHAIVFRLKGFLAYFVQRVRCDHA
jgi:hypothetical protein